MRICSIDGRLCKPEDATLSVMDHGFLYGDGVFEGLRFYGHKVFRIGAHLRRLKDSAAAIGLQLPITEKDMHDAVDQAVHASGLISGYIRLVVTRGEGSLGLDPGSCANPRTIIIVDELSMIDEKLRQTGIKVVFASIRRLAADQQDARIKSLNYMTQILAKQEANAAGAQEAIILNQAGRIAEGTADNVFIVKNNKLLTPPTSEGALEGITRSTIFELASNLGINCEESLLSTYDLYTADECFLTGTGAELIPVATVTATRLPNERPVFSRLNVLFGKLKYNDDMGCVSASIAV